MTRLHGDAASLRVCVDFIIMDMVFSISSITKRKSYKCTIYILVDTCFKLIE